MNLLEKKVTIFAVLKLVNFAKIFTLQDKIWQGNSLFIIDAVTHCQKFEGKIRLCKTKREKKYIQKISSKVENYREALSKNLYFVKQNVYDFQSEI